MSEALHTDITAPVVADAAGAVAGITDPTTTATEVTPVGADALPEQHALMMGHLQQLLISVGYNVADEFGDLVSLAIKRSLR